MRDGAYLYSSMRYGLRVPLYLLQNSTPLVVPVLGKLGMAHTCTSSMRYGVCCVYEVNEGLRIEDLGLPVILTHGGGVEGYLYSGV